MLSRFKTGDSPGYAHIFIESFEVPIRFSHLHTTSADGPFILRYTPPLMYAKSPADNTFESFSQVANGLSIVPGFESLPLVATKYVVPHSEELTKKNDIMKNFFKIMRYQDS